MTAAFDGDPTWRSRRELPDGTPFVIRPITPDDREGLVRGFHEASPETRYLRLGVATPELTDAALTYLTNVDQKDHVAIAATMTTPDLKTERGIGVARFVRSQADPAVAEAAVAVVDDMQRKGVGRALVEELGRAAILRGVLRFRAEVLRSNAFVRTILEAVGAKPLATPAEPDAVVYELDLTETLSRPT